VLGAGEFAAWAGALLALYSVSVTPSVLGIFSTIDGLAMTIIGGMETLIGPIIGASIVQLLGYWLERSFEPTWTLIYGTIFVVIVTFFPFGIVGTIRARSFQWKAGWRRWLELLGVGGVQRSK
jgi:branched-chain amino acid transport system permease protein